MESFDEVALFNLAIELGLPELLSLCQTNKKMKRLICDKDNIWNYRLNKDFPEETVLREKFRSLNMSPKNSYQTLYSLNNFRTKFGFGKESLLYLYNRDFIPFINIDKIPKELKLLPNLRILNLAHNLKKIDPAEILKTLKDLPNLKILYLDKKQISQIDKLSPNLPADLKKKIVLFMPRF